MWEGRCGEKHVRFFSVPQGIAFAQERTGFISRFRDHPEFCIVLLTSIVFKGFRLAPEHLIHHLAGMTSDFEIVLEEVLVIVRCPAGCAGNLGQLRARCWQLVDTFAAHEDKGVAGVSRQKPCFAQILDV